MMTPEQFQANSARGLSFVAAVAVLDAATDSGEPDYRSRRIVQIAEAMDSIQLLGTASIVVDSFLADFLLIQRRSDLEEV